LVDGLDELGTMGRGVEDALKLRWAHQADSTIVWDTSPGAVIAGDEIVGAGRDGGSQDQVILGMGGDTGNVGCDRRVPGRRLNEREIGPYVLKRESIADVPIAEGTPQLSQQLNQSHDGISMVKGDRHAGFTVASV
jgi:hypothetical protein